MAWSEVKYVHDVATPPYDWEKDLGSLDHIPYKKGQNRVTHPMVRALGNMRTRKHAYEVLRRACIACEGRVALLARLLGTYPDRVTALLHDAGLATVASDLRASYGHGGHKTGYGPPLRLPATAPLTSDEAPRPPARWRRASQAG